MPTSSTDNFLPRGKLLENTGGLSSGDSQTTGWRKALEHSTVVGYFITDPGASNVDLTIEQSIDKEEVDISDSFTPDAPGSATPFEVDLVGKFVKVTLTANEDVSSVRLITYKSTRVSSL